jgi:selenocysteine-specific elongation factor
MARVIVGTAGHIDHGKSTLVRALTGTDPDRLPEEKRRGITIDLGYAFLGEVAAIIDVPGHEKLVRNMVAGAATVDFALLVIAADDGIMPQTTEHLQILRLLGVQQGAVAITKCDAVESEWLELVEDQVRTAISGTFLADAPIFKVDSVSGRGIPELRDALNEILVSLPQRSEHGVFRLPIDRVFVVKGRGTVITGTVLSGVVLKDARLAVLPGGLDVRVKRIETHGTETVSIGAGQRAALNLIGKTEALSRGQTLTFEGALLATSRVRVAFETLPRVEPVEDRQRIRFLIGTQEAIGRVQLLSKSDAGLTFANLLLEEEVVAAWRDHFIIRRYSPLETLGGGVVLEPAPPRLRVRDLPEEVIFADALRTESIGQASFAFLKWRGRFGIEKHLLAASLAITPDELKTLVDSASGSTKAIDIGPHLILQSRFEEIRNTIRARLAELHRQNPDSFGFGRTDLKSGDLTALPDLIFDRALEALFSEGAISREGAVFRAPDSKVVLSAGQMALNDQVIDMLRAGGFAPPLAGVIAETLRRSQPEVEKALVTLERSGRCVRIGLDLFFYREVFADAVNAIKAALTDSAEITVSDVGRILSSSRKYVVPFLEFLDSRGITQRSGNVRNRGPHFDDVS